MPAAVEHARAVAAPDRPVEALHARRQAPAPRTGRRWHVCFVAPHAWPVLSGDPGVPEAGGAEMQQSILARLFAANGYRVTMICQDCGQPDGIEVDGVAVRKVFAAGAGLPGVRFLHPRLTTMWRVLREVDADIYYYRSASMWVGLLAEFCRRRGKRLVYAAASDPDFEPGIGGQIRFARDRWLYRRGLARAHALVAQNARQMASARRHCGRDAVHIPSCYGPVEAVRLRAGAGDVVLWVAMLRPAKRPELFLELARRLPAQRFVLVGGAAPGERSLFERVAAEARRLPNVRLTGFLPLAEVEAWFDRARVLVNTSRYEGMPNTFLQAWARGLPTLATVDVGVAAHRVAADLDDLARELERLLADRGAWHEASARCRAHFEREHAPAEVMARYATLFDAVMSGPEARR